jgi:hypothetical protein
MSDAPERIWAFYAPDIAEDENGATIVAHEVVQHGGAEYTRADLHRAEVEAAVKRALDHYASAVRTLWAKCEQVEDACYEHLNNGKALSEHEQGFWRGQNMLAKSIRRSTEMPASDPEALRRIITPPSATEQ